MLPFLFQLKGGKEVRKVFKITQTLNNNAAFAKDGLFKEVILIQQGIGYLSKNDKVAENDNVQVFTPQTDIERKRFKQFLEAIPFEFMEFAINTVSLAKRKFNLKFSNSLVFTLADHISFAVERYRENESFDYLSNEEIKQFFPDIYKFSKKTVRQINKKFNVHLAEGEATAITFHLINSLVLDNSSGQKNLSDTKTVFDITSAIMQIIENNYSHKIDRKSISYSRLVVHIRYLVTNILHSDTNEETEIGRAHV